MKWIITLALLLSACSSQKKVVESHRHEVVKCDSVGARLDSEFHIRLHDVVVMPADSSRTRVCVKVKEVELDRTSRAAVETRSREQVNRNTQVTQTRQPAASKLHLYLIIALLLYILLLRSR